MIAILILGLTLAFILLWRSGTGKIDRERANLEEIRPSVSVIIPAYNSGRTLEKCLESVKGLDYPKKQVIVANDSQGDGKEVSRICKKHSVDLVQNKKRMGKAMSLNNAMKKARGEILFFLDSDTIAERGCLKKLMPWFSAKDTGAVAPKYLVWNKTPLTRMVSMENSSIFTNLKTHMNFGSMIGFRGCGVAIRRRALEKMGGWRNTLVEDLDLGLRMFKGGFRIKFEPRAIIRTEEPETGGDFCRQRFRWAKGSIIMFLRNYGTYLRSPQFALYFLPYIVLGLAALLFIVLGLVSVLLFRYSLLAFSLELLAIFSSFILHGAVMTYLERDETLPLKATVKFALLHTPRVVRSYWKGMVSGIKTMKRKDPEISLGDW